MWKILSSVVETDQCFKSYCWKTVTDIQVTISKGKLPKIDFVLPEVLLRPASALISSTQWEKKIVYYHYSFKCPAPRNTCLSISLS